MISEKAAVAFTFVVVNMLENHCSEQAENLSNDYKEFKSILMEFKDDDLNHLETLAEHYGENAPDFELIKAIAQLGCKTTINLSENYDSDFTKLNFLVLYPNTRNPAKIRVNNLEGNVFHFFSTY